MRKPTKQLDGTSWFYRSIIALPIDLIAIAKGLEADYLDNNTGEGRTNFEFAFMTDEGYYFTVYDWKIGMPLDMTTPYEFHIGGFTDKGTRVGKEALLKKLKELGA